MGFVIVFKATNVVNFAHASVVMLGAYLVAKWHDVARVLRRDRRRGGRLRGCRGAARPHLRAPAAPPRRRRRRAGDHDDRDQRPARDRARARWSAPTSCPPARPGARTRPHILGAQIPQARIAAALVALGLMVVFYVVFTRTNWGVAMRAAADRPGDRRADGHPSAAAWPARRGRSAGALAAIGGAFFVRFPAARRQQR